MNTGGDPVMTATRLMKATTSIKAPALLLVFVSALSAQTSAPSWELADPNAKVLIGIDVRGVRESQVGKSLTSQMEAQGTAAPVMPFKIPGIELLSDIDSVFISSTGEVPVAKPVVKKTAASTASKAAASKNPPFLIVLKGTFPDDHLRPLLEGKHPSYKAVNIYGGTGTDASNLAVLDEHTVIFGDENSIRAAIDRKATKPAALSPVFARAKELAASDDFWIVAKDTSSNLQQAAGPNPFTSEIDGIEMGMQLHDGLGIDVNLATKTEAAAGMFAQLLSMQIQSAVATKMDDPRAAELVRKLQVGSQGNRMTIHLALSQEEMEQSIQLAQAARANARAASTEHASSTMSPTASPSEPVQAPASTPAGPRKVRIYGLDEGVREITLDPKR
jgi:hypothetical protein